MSVGQYYYLAVMYTFHAYKVTHNYMYPFMTYQLIPSANVNDSPKFRKWSDEVRRVLS